MNDPRKALEAVSLRLREYGVGFALLREGDSRRGVGGSGILVRLDDKPGILTARHVVDTLPKSGNVGLMCPTTFLEDRVFCPEVDIAYCHSVSFPPGSDASLGPDIALVFLPNAVVSTLESTKSFVNLNRQCQRVAESPPDPEEGYWFLCGCAEEWTVSKEFQGKDASSFRWECCLSVLVDREERGDFDYVKMSAYVDEGTVTPMSFGGFSGGGLWNVIVHAERDPILTLSGVAFYGSDQRDKEKRVICHYYKSIYKALLSKARADPT